MKRILLCLVMVFVLILAAQFASARGGRGGGGGHYGGYHGGNPSGSGQTSMEELLPTTPVHVEAVTYTGNVKTRKYHRPGCRFYDCHDCTLKFKSLEAARKAGYTPCGVCGG